MSVGDLQTAPETPRSSVLVTILAMIEEGKLAEAARALARAAQEALEGWQVHWLKGRLLIERGCATKAYGELRQAAAAARKIHAMLVLKMVYRLRRLDPPAPNLALDLLAKAGPPRSLSGRVTFWCGRNCRVKGEFAEAIKHFTRCRDDPMYGQRSFYEAGLAYLQQSHWSDAVAAFRRAQGDDAELAARAALVGALCAEKEGRTELASELRQLAQKAGATPVRAQEAEDKSTDLLETRPALSSLVEFVVYRDIDRAEREMTRHEGRGLLPREKCLLAALRLGLAVLSGRGGELDVAAFRELLAEARGSVPGQYCAMLLSLGTHSDALGRHEECVEVLRACASAGITLSADLLLTLGHSLVECGQLDEARRVIAEAEIKCPESMGIAFEKSLLSLKLGDVHRAAQEAEEACRLHQDSSRPWLLLAYTLERLSPIRIQRCIEAAGHAEEVNALDPDAAHQLGRYLRLAGRYDEALAAIHRAAGLGEEEQRTEFEVGMVYANRGEWSLAKDAFERSSSAAEYPATLLALAYCWNRLGSPTEEAACRQRADELGLRDEERELVLRDIERRHAIEV